MPIKTKNYLNNNDLMEEIHKSKTSFSSFTDRSYHKYDMIVDTLDMLDNSVELAKQNRAKRLTKEKYINAFNEGYTDAKQNDFLIDPDTIPKESLIFRVMTFDHIPLDTERKKNPKTTADHHVRLNFPPFQHWKYDNDGFLRCVGKSHWVGDMETGYFSLSHGKPTDKLGHMWMKMCERYATRGNIRSYTYNDEMRSQALVQLVEVGLQFNEYMSNNPFSYSTSIIANSCIRIINAEKKNQQIRDDILEANNMDPSYTRTHQHEWDNMLKRQELD